MLEGQVLVVLVVLGLGALLGLAVGPRSRKEKLTLDQVPAAVRDTILREAAGRPLKEIERKTSDAATLYEAEWLLEGKEIEIKVGPDGALLDRAVEENVALHQVPDPVRATILRESAGVPLKELERETRGAETLYEAEWIAGGQKIEIKISPDGTVIRRKAKEAHPSPPLDGRPSR